MSLELHPRPTYYLRCRKALKSAEFPCKATAKIHKKSLRVMNLSGEHSCERDPDIKFEILAKNEMKELAETTSESNRSIFEKGTFSNDVQMDR